MATKNNPFSGTCRKCEVSKIFRPRFYDTCFAFKDAHTQPRRKLASPHAADMDRPGCPPGTRRIFWRMAVAKNRRRSLRKTNVVEEPVSSISSGSIEPHLTSLALSMTLRFPAPERVACLSRICSPGFDNRFHFLRPRVCRRRARERYGSTRTEDLSSCTAHRPLACWSTQPVPRRTLTPAQGTLQLPFSEAFGHPIPLSPGDWESYLTITTLNTRILVLRGTGGSRTLPLRPRSTTPPWDWDLR